MTCDIFSIILSNYKHFGKGTVRGLFTYTCTKGNSPKLTHVLVNKFVLKCLSHLTQKYENNFWSGVFGTNKCAINMIIKINNNRNRIYCEI